MEEYGKYGQSPNQTGGVNGRREWEAPEATGGAQADKWRHRRWTRAEADTCGHRRTRQSAWGMEVIA